VRLAAFGRAIGLAVGTRLRDKNVWIESFDARSLSDAQRVLVSHSSIKNSPCGEFSRRSSRSRSIAICAPPRNELAKVSTRNAVAKRESTAVLSGGLGLCRGSNTADIPPVTNGSADRTIRFARSPSRAKRGRRSLLGFETALRIRVCGRVLGSGRVWVGRVDSSDWLKHSNLQITSADKKPRL